MKISYTGIARKVGLMFCCIVAASVCLAQTDIDGVMMKKNNFCGGLTYEYSSWKNYWEGTLKRDNQNIGTLSTKMVSVMGTYGISNKLNVLVGLPYIKTNATGGTLHGQEGVQDLSLFVKWMPVTRTIGKGILYGYGIVGYSMPVTSYVADLQPYSIGLKSKNLYLRVMGDYHQGAFFVTGSATYVYRSNITIDRNAYFTTEMHYTNEVEMPDAMQFNLHTGYRHKGITAEAILDNWTTLGGFDITRNNFPFPSNRMNATRVGVNGKYELHHFIPGVSFVGGGNYVIAGRNMGQATTVYAGIFYIIDFKHRVPNTVEKSTKPN
jgi:hypothetical protein